MDNIDNIDIKQDIYIITFPVDLKYNLDKQKYHFYILTKKEIEYAIKNSVQEMILEKFILERSSLATEEVAIGILLIKIIIKNGIKS